MAVAEVMIFAAETDTERAAERDARAAAASDLVTGAIVLFEAWAGSQPPAADTLSIPPRAFGANVLLVVCGARPAFHFMYPSSWGAPPKCGLEAYPRHVPGHPAEIIYSRGPALRYKDWLEGSYESMLALGLHTGLLGYTTPLPPPADPACGAVLVYWRLYRGAPPDGWEVVPDSDNTTTAWAEWVRGDAALALVTERHKHVEQCLEPFGWSCAALAYGKDQPQLPDEDNRTPDEDDDWTPDEDDDWTPGDDDWTPGKDNRTPDEDDDWTPGDDDWTPGDDDWTPDDAGRTPDDDDWTPAADD